MFFNNPRKKSLSEIYLNGFIFLGIFWYMAVCLVNYFSLRPLWNDEVCVLRSIEQFSTQDFFNRPLLSVQVFPRCYLLLIQKISQPFNFHLLALRFLPFVCMITAFFVWLKIAQQAFNNRLEYLTFVLSWSASSVLIYYSGELKQYSMDVLVAGLFVLFLYNQERIEKEKGNFTYTLILVALSFLPFFSYIAYFLYFLPLYNLVLNIKEHRSSLRPLVFYSVTLLVVIILSYHFDMRFKDKIITQAWQDYFISLKSFPQFLKTLGEGTNNLYSRWFIERPKILKEFAIFFVTFGFIYKFIGFFKNIKSQRYRLYSIDTMALVIFIELFIMGVFKKYPFTVPRTSLFFCPIVLYLTIKGVVSVKSIHKNIYALLHSSYFFFLIFLIIALSFFVGAGQLTFRPVLW